MSEGRSAGASGFGPGGPGGSGGSGGSGGRSGSGSRSGDRTIIVGTGVAGATAALTLRSEGYQGPITMIGEEHELPYRRPPLSKEVLRGATAPERIAIKAAPVWAGLDIEMRTGTRVPARRVPDAAPAGRGGSAVRLRPRRPQNQLASLFSACGAAMLGSSDDSGSVL